MQLISTMAALLALVIAARGAKGIPAPAAPILERVGMLEGSGGGFVHFSPDGAKLLTTDDRGSARIWDVKTLKPITPEIKHGAAIGDCGWTSGGHRIFTAGGNEVRIWDPATGRLVTKIAQDAPVCPMCMSPDGKLLVMHDAKGPGAVWDVEKGRKIGDLPGPGTLVSVSFGQAEKCLLTVSSAKSPQEPDKSWLVHVLDRTTFRDLMPPVWSDAFVWCGPKAALSPDESLLVVAMHKSFQTFDVARARELYEVNYDGQSLDGGTSLEVHFTSNGDAVLWVDDEYTSRFEAKTGKEIEKRIDKTLAGGFPGDDAISRDARLLFFAGLAQQAGVYGLDAGRRLQAFSDRQSHCLDLSRDGGLVAVSYENGGLPSEGFTEIWKVQPLRKR